MDGSDKRTGTGAGQAIGVGVALLLGVVVAAVAVAKVTMPAPNVGDILVVRPSGDMLGLRLDVQKVAADGAPGPSCVLDPDTMARSGGSLVVEAHTPGSVRPYVVHWAGGPTSAEATDCGSDADLALDVRDIVRLSQGSADPRSLRFPVAASMMAPTTSAAVD